MRYFDRVVFDDARRNSRRIDGFLDRISSEVNEYFSSFKDSPENISRWGHHYFCEAEGGPLIYNPEDSRNHVCSICRRSYSSELLTGVWHTMYRNQGATNAWKAALLYVVGGERQHLDWLINYVSYYDEHYLEFRLHNKEGLESDRLEDAPWGVSRIMPQALNEAIYLVRLINALELVRKHLPVGFIERLRAGIFGEAYQIFRPQVREIHNISTWLDCAIGMIGLFAADSEMVEFAFNGEFGILNQLEKGVTQDYFWYEGSIHYNMFLLEGVVNLLLFAALYGHEFGPGKKKVAGMLKAAYTYAFDSHRLPNPNDGWPDVNLKTYSYIYAMAVKVLGQGSEAANILLSILAKEGERGTVPLSKPYYFENDISLEEMIFVPTLRRTQSSPILSGSINFPTSHCALLKAQGTNIFLKYGHNGPSHAHPDKMNVEVQFQGVGLSRDLSNSGYGNPLCDGWHRVSASHNTVVVDGANHTGFDGGRCLIAEDDRFRVRADDVYEGVDFIRDVSIHENGFTDCFEVAAVRESTLDFFFHVEADSVEGPLAGPADLGYSANGYQYLEDIRCVQPGGSELSLIWSFAQREIVSTIHCAASEVFLMKSPDNPIVKHRYTILIRQKGKKGAFHLAWNAKKNNYTKGV